MKCRFCNHVLTKVFVDLGQSPPSNSFLSKEDLLKKEVFYPLKIYVCDSCFLVQVDEVKKAEEIFSKDYVYFSSMSRTWLEHSCKYVQKMISDYAISKKSLVVEIASNDGYLLQYFKKNGVPVLGIEPTHSTSQVARNKGIETRESFFGIQLAAELAGEGKHADLLLGNNVLAHVPDINDFVAGLHILLKPEGMITMEFPHLLQMVQNNQFDTIYHEHFSYLSFSTVKRIFAKHRLELFDVEELPTHGGSLRVYAKHQSAKLHPVTNAVVELLQKEESMGMNNLLFYEGFERKALQIKTDFLKFLSEAEKQGKTIAGYGAAAKGNTLLNYCGVSSGQISFVVDAAPSKQGKFLPGSHIPVVPESELVKSRPDFILIFPWNIRTEIVSQLSYIREWGGKFVILIPNLQIL